MIKYNGINHLAFATADMDMTIRFWRDLLEMRLVAGIGDQKFKHYFFELSDTDMVAFFEWPAVEKVDEKDHGVPVKGAFAFDHVSFGVETADDLWNLRDRIVAAGFWVSEVIDHGFIHSVYTFDPNNIPIEFSVAVDNIDLRKHPQMKDKTPSSVTLEGSDPVPGHWPKVTHPTPVSERTIYPGEGLVLSEFADEKNT
jgi:catechol 2,3-dioxygenase-like lactoylglutathione lyase family enzyme